MSGAVTRGTSGQGCCSAAWASGECAHGGEAGLDEDQGKNAGPWGGLALE